MQKGWCVIKVLDVGKKGKLHLRFLLVAAIIAAAVYAYSALAAVPSAVPAIVNANGTAVRGAFVANFKAASASCPIKRVIC